MGETPENDSVEDRSGDKLTPEEAYQLTEEKGYAGKTVAKMFDVSPGWVSQQKNEFKKGIEKGRDSVSPNDFGREDLETALADKKSEDDEYDCPNCDRSYDYMEVETCDNCGTPFNWDAL